MSTNRILAGCAALILSTQAASAVEVINLRSGFDEGNNVPLLPGQQDNNITMLFNGVGGSQLSPVPFTAADFTAAQTGPVATSIAPILPWAGGNPAPLSDPLARWINYLPAAGPSSSVLYAMPFNVTTTGITGATMTFEWMVDDHLGDLSNGANPAGVYLGIGTNPGTATTPIITAGNFGAPTIQTVNVLGQIQTGLNYLYVYQRDIGFSASGVIFSTTLTIVPEPGTAGLLLASGTALLLRRRH
jgi:hypothetical protein